MRLAAYLKPEPNLERKHVRAVVVKKKAEKSSGWGRLESEGSSRRKSSAEPTQTSPLTSPSLGVTSPTIGRAEDHSVKITVRAEELMFRKENDFGVWESRTGFGIVVTVN